MENGKEKVDGIKPGGKGVEAEKSVTGNGAKTPEPGTPKLGAEAKPAGGPDLKSIVQATVQGAAKPSEEAIAAHQARKAAADQGAEGAGKGAGQAGKKRGPYKAAKGSTATSSLQKVSEEKQIEAYRQVGYQVADLLVTAGLTLGGEDWKPALVKDEKGNVLFDEQGNLRTAWGDFAEEYKWEKFPPWLGVTLATASYVGPRMFAPSTKARMSRFKLWLDAWKLKRQEKREEKDRAAKERREREEKAHA